MRANSKLSVLRSIRYLSRPVLDILYKQQIRSVIDYGLVLFYGGLTQSDIAKLDRIQYRSAKVVTGALHFTSRIKLDQDLGWESLAERYELLGLSLFHKIAHNNVRPLLRSLLPKTKDKIPGQMMNMKISLDQTKNTINLSSHTLLDLGITSKRKSEMTKTIITSKKN